jgi:hypothetical protein
MEVIPTQYSIRSYPYEVNGVNHPKSWCFEVSRDGNSWICVHECRDNDDLNGSNRIGMYAVLKSIVS